MLSVELAVEVIQGRLGIAFAGKDGGMPVSSHERLLSAMPVVQHVVISTKSAEADRVILRNTAHDGTKTVFKLKNVDVRLQAYT